MGRSPFFGDAVGRIPGNVKRRGMHAPNLIVGDGSGRRTDH
jgi:hypothetical protein